MRIHVIAGLALCVLLGITACGFHLRQDVPTLHWAYVLDDASGYAEFVDRLRHSLPSIAKKKHRLRVDGLEKKVRVRTIGADGKVRDYGLLMKLSWSLPELNKRFQIEEGINQRFDKNLVLAQEVERQHLFQVLEQRLIRRVQERLLEVEQHAD